MLGVGRLNGLYLLGATRLNMIDTLGVGRLNGLVMLGVGRLNGLDCRVQQQTRGAHVIVANLKDS